MITHHLIVKSLKRKSHFNHQTDNLKKRPQLLTCLLYSSIFCFGFSVASAQYFGKNKVTNQQFGWMIHRTEHFDIYYYTENSRLVPIMADIAEEAYEKHSEDFKHQIKSRTPLILYQSHTDFRDTNIILQELSEGIGGFAEIFKRRVVIPFTGSLETFREVIFHELVHIFQYDIIYQKPVARIYSGEFMYSAPIWFIEGSADYLANDINAMGEMVLRDGCLDNKILPLTRLKDFRALGSQIYLGYKIGQSAVGYLADTYGREKIGEIMYELRQSRTKNLDKAFKNTLNITVKEFDKNWQNWLKKKYWPMMADKDFPETVATNVTEDSRYSHSIKPIWSPSGDIVAYITGNEGFGEIILVSAKTGKRLFRVSKRFFQNEYEDILTNGNGLAWSPDGDRIAFLARYRKSIHLLEIDILAEEIRTRIKLKYDAAYSPTYHPNGERIAFAALDNNQMDLFTINLEDRKIERVTDDPFDDNYPVWHPKKNQIVYSSEREGKNRLVLLDLDRNTGWELTHDQYNAVAPNWSLEGDKVIFSADLSDVFDLYTLNADGTELIRLTHILTGCSDASFSPDMKRILFSGYRQGKQDVYIMEMEKAVNQKIDLPPVERTEFAQELPQSETVKRRIARRKYQANVGIDAIFTDFSLRADGLLRNMTELIASDMMGNHRFGLSLINQSGYFAPDFVASYGYLEKQANFGASIFNYHEYHILSSITSRRGVLQQITGFSGYISYPFNRYRRLDLKLELYSTPFTYNYASSQSFDNPRGLLSIGSLSFVSDTTRWRQFGPHAGTRSKLSVEKAFPQIGSALDLTNFMFDTRRYFKVGRRSTIATRLLLGGSFGPDQSLFYLGGIDTLRSYNYEDLIGTRIGLLNVELRIPFIDELRFGWPLEWSIGGIRGIAFSDFGTVWSDDSNKSIFIHKEYKFGPNNPYQAANTKGNSIRLKDIKGSIGIGMRLQLGLFALDFVAARRTDLSRIEPKVTYHFGLGQAF
ncbi:TPA: hypothetical protein EYO77_04440 [Candidatus Poribacteria bacterium]|nr:hypothetical protein [Candidatus Poribacteria bacterium]